MCVKGWYELLKVLNLCDSSFLRAPHPPYLTPKPSEPAPPMHACRMARYVFKRRPDGVYVFDLAKTWAKLVLAARVIVAIENPQANDILAHMHRAPSH